MGPVRVFGQDRCSAVTQTGSETGRHPSSSRSSTSSTPMSTSGTSDALAKQGCAARGRPSMSAARRQRWTSSMPSAPTRRPARLRCCAVSAPMSRTTPRGWTTYASWRSKWPIGSGAVESRCKTLIEAREKGSGVRWTRASAQSVATMHAVRTSGDWAAFWARHPLRVCPYWACLLCLTPSQSRGAPLSLGDSGNVIRLLDQLSARRQPARIGRSSHSARLAQAVIAPSRS